MPPVYQTWSIRDATSVPNLEYKSCHQCYKRCHQCYKRCHQCSKLYGHPISSLNKCRILLIQTQFYCHIGCLSMLPGQHQRLSINGRHWSPTSDIKIWCTQVKGIVPFIKKTYLLDVFMQLHKQAILYSTQKEEFYVFFFFVILIFIGLCAIPRFR